MDGRGNLYGTTYLGGSDQCSINGEPIAGCGTVFKLTMREKEKVLHSFSGTPDGAGPQGGLINDTQGNLYGTTYVGGRDGCGTVFKLSPRGDETILFSPSALSEGCYLGPDLVMDSIGNLYGTAEYGGPGRCGRGCGVIFKVSPGGSESTLYNFGSGPVGTNPNQLLVDSSGNLYGTTLKGGTGGHGIVFELTVSGTFEVLYEFHGSDGSSPSGLIMNNAGNLYGTTMYGGYSNCQNVGCGTIFEFSRGSMMMLHSFEGTDGAFPNGLTLDASGDLYGTTMSGGSRDVGTVFELTSN